MNPPVTDWRASKRSMAGLMLKCFVLILTIRITLSLWSYLPVLKHIRTVEGKVKNRRDLRQFVYAIQKTSRFIPGASCLTQALALRWLMARADIESRIRIGVRNDADGEMKAHAWVIFRDRILIGGKENEMDRYTPIVDL